MKPGTRASYEERGVDKSRQPANGPRPPADDAAIRDLIDEVRNIRTLLDADLSVAAAAVDEGEPQIARDIVADDLADVAAFRASAMQRLANEPVVIPSQPRMSRRARALIAIPAVPLIGALAMTAAAAIGGGPTPQTPTTHVVTHAVGSPAATASHETLRSNPHTTLQRLADVVHDHKDASQVITVADDLHKQLTQLIDNSPQHPAQLGVVRRLLDVEQHLLEGDRAPGSTVALAASRAVEKLLAKTTLVLKSVPTSIANPTPTPAVTHAPSTPKPHHHTTTSPPNTSPSTPRAHHPHRSPTPSHTPFDPLFGNGVFSDVL